MSSPLPLLVVLAGRPGTGKTTLSRALARALPAAYVRVDAIETAVVRGGLATHPLGPVGYTIAREIVAGNLAIGISVVVDAVNPVPEARAGWRSIAAISRIVFIETSLRDETEHRRRVLGREPDMAGQIVPTWDDVAGAEYVPWDETRDGPRLVVDTTDGDDATITALSYLRDHAAR